MLAWSLCVDMNRAEEVQLFRKSREVSLRSNGNRSASGSVAGISGGVGGGGAGGPSGGAAGGNVGVRIDDGDCIPLTELKQSPLAAEGGGDELLLQQRRRWFDGGKRESSTEARPAAHHHQRRMPRFGEAHHRRVPTPLKKRRKPREDFADLPTPSSDADDAAIVEVVTATGDAKPPAPAGVPDPYYPIYLPIDQAFKAKYVFHQRKGKTFQEKVYVFLEHPCGWICFIYHFAV